MSLMPSAPESIGGVLDRAVRLYGKSIFPCFPIVLVMVILLAIPSVLLSVNVQSVATKNPFAAFAVLQSPVVLLAYLAMIIVMSVLYGALFARINAVAHGESLASGAAFGIGIRRAPSMLGVSILFSLMVGVGMILLLIPGVWLWGVFQLAFVAVIIEPNGVFKAFGTSAELVKNNWWRTSAIIFVGVVIITVLALVVSLLAGIVAAISLGVARTGGAATVAGTLTTVQLIAQICSAVVSLFTTTFFPCVLLAVYHDLKLRKEGADLADRVGALNPAS